MKTLISSVTAALLLGAGMAQAGPYINHYDASLAGSPDSDNSVELANVRDRGTGGSFINHYDASLAGSVDSDNTLELRGSGGAGSGIAFVNHYDASLVGSVDGDAHAEFAAELDVNRLPATAAGMPH